MKKRWLLIVSLLSVIAVAWAQSPEQTAAPLIFRVNGEAQAFPETAVLRFTVVGDGETLIKAQEQLQQVEQAIFKALEKFGISRGQIVTDRFAVIPLQPSVLSGLPTTALRPLGYRVQKGYSIMLPVSAEKLDKLLQIADAVLQQGARPTAIASDERYGYSERTPYTLLEFMVHDPDKLLQQAMDDALQRARRLAEQASKQIGKVTLRLVRLQVANIQTFPERRTVTPEGRDPINTFAWQPVRVTVQIEAAFTYE